MSKNISELSSRKGLKENLFEEIGLIAKEQGTPSVEEMEALADKFLIGKANVYGSASFYDFTREENRGKKVYVCNGTACLCAGTQDAVKEKLESNFKAEEIGEVCCLGRCHENSAFFYEGRNYSGQDIDEFKPGSLTAMDQYHIECKGAQVLTGDPLPVEEYYQIFLDALKKSPEEVLAEIKTSNVRGRGGAGFPMWFKLDACAKEPAGRSGGDSDTKYIVCNADEGDPGAYSDRYLLEKQPHAVLMGMMLAGYVTGANWGVLYIRAEYPESIDIIEKELVDLYDAGWLGEDIKGTGFNFDFKIIKAQGAYICGEETALLNSIEGQRPEVRVRPPFPAQKGLFNKPTIVNNVETLACIPWILKNGGETYASIGNGKSTGTKLISLDSGFNRPGMYEVDMGTPLSTVVNDLGQGFSKKIKALHIGGPLGGMVPVSKIDSLDVSFESFAESGFLLGHASVVSVPEDFPMVKYIEHLFEFTAHESCGKCFPCRLGSTRGAEMFNKAQNEDYKLDRELVDDLLETMEIGSLCALGGGLPLPIKNSLQYFESELKEYFN